MYYRYSTAHKDQNNVKKKSKCEITFYSIIEHFIKENRDIKVNLIIPKCKVQLTYFDKVTRIITKHSKKIDGVWQDFANGTWLLVRLHG